MGEAPPRRFTVFLQTAFSQRLGAVQAPAARPDAERMKTLAWGESNVRRGWEEKRVRWCVGV